MKKIHFEKISNSSIIGLFTTLIFFIFINSCKQNENYKSNNTPFNNAKTELIIDNKKIDSNKIIFLDYWIGMNKAQASKHTQDLINQHLLDAWGVDSFYYNFNFPDGNVRALVEFNYDSIQLTGIDIIFLASDEGNIVSKNILKCEEINKGYTYTCTETINHIKNGERIEELYKKKYKLDRTYMNCPPIIDTLKNSNQLDPIDKTTNFGCPFKYEFLNKDVAIILSTWHKQVRKSMMGVQLSRKVKEVVWQLVISYRDKSWFQEKVRLYNEKIKQEKLEQENQLRQQAKRVYKDI